MTGSAKFIIRFAILSVGFCLLLASGAAGQAIPFDDESAAAAAVLEKTYAGQKPPEAARMLIAILRGSQMGADAAWFGPAETRYSWPWLAARHGVDPSTGSIPKEKFRGKPEWFARLDRNKDGRIAAEDLDWSERSYFAQQARLVERLFRKIDPKRTGRVSREQMLKFFDVAAQGKGYMTPDDLRDAMLSGLSDGFQPGDAPTTAMLVRGVFSGEIGSMNEGPHVDQPAPDFSLNAVDGKSTCRLSQVVGKRPVVLVFGNFTCGPFRGYYPEVEAVHQRHAGEAEFLTIYVREAHPSDGWRMATNDKLGVSVKQPTTGDERRKTAGQFCAMLKPTMPVLVDEISDPVGNNYSAMPIRLYVIDREGKVAFKSGRGPFGFRVGEMEQALVMALLEHQAQSTNQTAAQK